MLLSRIRESIADLPEQIVRSKCHPAGTWQMSTGHLRLGQHRTIWQADSARDFSSSQGLKSEGILYVFRTFQTAELAEKIRRSAQTQLCGVALDWFDSRLSSRYKKSTPGGVLFLYGAGYGNRTRLCGLGSDRSTDELTLRCGVIITDPGQKINPFLSNRSRLTVPEWTWRT